MGQVSEDAVNRTNAALGFLAHLVQLLGKYFMVGMEREGSSVDPSALRDRLSSLVLGDF